MQDNDDAMRTALRVISAICEHFEPAPADLEELRRIAPELAALSPEKLANAIIRSIVEKRQKGRAREASE
jgi:hypothetical protein